MDIPIAVGAGQVRERIIVVLEPHPEIGRLLRTAKRKSETYNLDWEVLYIETPYMRQRLSEHERNHLLTMVTFAQEAGAIVTKIKAKTMLRGIRDVVEERIAQEIPIFSLKLAEIRKRYPWLNWSRPLREKVRAALGYKVFVATVPVGYEKHSSGRYNKLFHINGYEILSGLLAVAIATLFVEFIDYLIGSRNYSTLLIYITACAFATSRYGLIPGIATSAASLLTINFLYIPPYFDMSIQEPTDMVNLAIFTFCSLLLALLGSRDYDDRKEMARVSERLHSLLKLHRLALSKDSREDMISTMDNELRILLGTDALFFMPSILDDTKLEPVSPQPVELNAQEQKALETAWMESKTTGVGSSYHPEGCRWRFEPMVTSHDEVGVLAVRITHFAQLDVDFIRLLSGIADQIALILERLQIGESAQQNKINAEREKLRSMLLSSVSHDLKTPLASVIGSLSVYRSMGQSLPEEHRDTLLNTALDEAQRLDSFITNILDMTRIESGQIELKQEWVNPAFLIDEVLRRLRVRLRNHPLRIDTAAPHDIEVLMDGLMTGQVVQNLLDNAAKYTKHGTQIEVSWHTNDEGFTLQVRDYGEGIPEDKLERVFDKYARIKKQDTQVAGTGLGLAIARAVMKVQGGSITAGNHPDGGAIFSLRLPAFRKSIENKAA